MYCKNLYKMTVAWISVFFFLYNFQPYVLFSLEIQHSNLYILYLYGSEFVKGKEVEKRS